MENKVLVYGMWVPADKVEGRKKAVEAAMLRRQKMKEYDREQKEKERQSLISKGYTADEIYGHFGVAACNDLKSSGLVDMTPMNLDQTND